MFIESPELPISRHRLVHRAHRGEDHQSFRTNAAAHHVTASERRASTTARSLCSLLERALAPAAIAANRRALHTHVPGLGWGLSDVVKILCEYSRQQVEASASFSEDIDLVSRLGSALGHGDLDDGDGEGEGDGLAELLLSCVNTSTSLSSCVGGQHQRVGPNDANVVKRQNGFLYIGYRR